MQLDLAGTAALDYRTNALPTELSGRHTSFSLSGGLVITRHYNLHCFCFAFVSIGGCFVFISICVCACVCVCVLFCCVGVLFCLFVYIGG